MLLYLAFIKSDFGLIFSFSFLTYLLMFNFLKAYLFLKIIIMLLIKCASKLNFCLNLFFFFFF